MLGVAPDQGFYEGGFADAGGADDGDNYGGRFFGEAVDERDVKALFADLVVVSTEPSC